MALIYQQTTKETIDKLAVDPSTGLTTREAEKRRQKYGPNTIKVKGHPLWRKIIEPFLDIFMLILIVAMSLSLIQQSWLDATLIAIIIIADAAIYYIQQFSTDRILRSLSAKTVQTIEAIRDGAPIDIDASALVPGDIVVLSEGDRIPADGRIIDESGLLTNESMLTGESDPVAKNSHKLSGTKKIYEQTNMVFSGSFVITGTAKMLVTATGNATEYGRIASLASSAEPTSPIQEKINKLVFKIAIIVIALAAVIFVVQLIQQIPLIDSIEFTLAMIVSAVPEGLPITISIILALGAKRMAAQKALIKEMRAIESIGIVTTIASDKTGTLTANKLSLKTIWPLSASQPDFIKHIAESTLPATISTDPLDTAILGYLDHHHPTLTDIGPVHSYPFDQSLKISGNLYETTSGTLHLVIKGAPESILARCKISPENIEKVEAQINAMSSQGQKVIAIARIHQQHEINELTRLTKDDRFTFLGLISIADTLRPESAPAIKSAKKSGVSVKMITGDHSRTAFAIGKELGLATDPSQVLDCSKMGSMSDEDIVAIVKTATIFARVTPEDKFRILSAMKKSEITAMTGDGVNDVPALTNAHIGISMGDSPSIVQDASDIVLLDNNFKSIVSAIHEGRIVLTNIRRMLTYLLATNAGEAITITLALTFGHTGLLLPIQILWVNLVTDSLLVIPLGLEPAEPHFLHAKPEPKNSPILSATLIIRMIIIALTMATITLSVYLIALHLFTHEQANTLAFTALVVMQWANALSIRGLYDSILKRLSTPNLKFYIALTIAITLQILVITGPLAPLLHTAPTPPLALTIVSIVAFLIPILIVELHKFYVKITTKSR